MKRKLNLLPVVRKITNFVGVQGEVHESRVISGEKEFIQYASEEPILRYERQKKLEEKADCLNTFVKSITVANIKKGKRSFLEYGFVLEEPFYKKEVFYYEDNNGTKRIIREKEICNFLKEKPELIISPDGLLIFYTKEKILATMNFEQFMWVREKLAGIRTTDVIKAIYSRRNYLKVVVNSGRNAELYEEKTYSVFFELALAKEVPFRVRVKEI